MGIKITQRCISEIQSHLKEYVMEHSSKNKNRKFTCFNKSAHNNKRMRIRVQQLCQEAAEGIGTALVVKLKVIF